MYIPAPIIVLIILLSVIGLAHLLLQYMAIKDELRIREVEIEGLRESKENWKKRWHEQLHETEELILRLDSSRMKEQMWRNCYESLQKIS